MWKRTYKPIAVGLLHVIAHALLIIVTRDKDNLQQTKKVRPPTVDEYKGRITKTTSIFLVLPSFISL